jgi:hypothetical protein
MSLPQPFPGMVIRYGYLWFYEHLQGREESRKDRPAVIVIVIDDAPQKKVMVVPVTHQPPDPDTPAIEIPLLVKVHLGLDHERSWVICTEVNYFLWPGPDLVPVPDNPSEDLSYYGILPPSFFRIVRAKVIALSHQSRLKIAIRTE